MMVERVERKDPMDPAQAASLRHWGELPAAVSEQLRDEAWVECGWGRLIFAHTYASTERLADEYLVEAGYDPSLAFAQAHQSAPGAATSVDAALRLDTTVMLVDDPVKRVDNMTMAWGLEARVPFLDHDFVELAATCPADLKLAHGGKGVLKEASRALLPSAVIDRTKGYFPVPGIRHLEGGVLDLVADTLRSQAAIDRGLYRPETLEKLFADPNGIRTRLDGNELWQVALLEMWLQTMEEKTTR